MTPASTARRLRSPESGEDVGELPGGGHFGRGADGKLNGMVYEESAMLKFAVHFLGKITPEVAAKAVANYSAITWAPSAIRCCTSPAPSARNGSSHSQSSPIASPAAPARA